MRLIKLGLISIVVLFILATLIGLLLPSKVVVSRTVDIHAPADSIFSYMKNMHLWKQWIDGMDHPGVVINSPVSADLAGTRVDITYADSLQLAATWKGKNTATQYSTQRIIQQEQVCIVNWQFEQQVKWYPWERLGTMMNDKIIGTMMEKDLANLKKLLESSVSSK